MKIKEALKFSFVLFIKLFGIATLFAIVGYSFHVPVIGMFVIGFVVNLIAGIGFTYYYNLQHEKLIVKQNLAMLEFEEKQTAKVKCAYCHKENIVPIDMSNTKFKCNECGLINRLIATFETAQITVPQSTKDMIGRGV